MTALGLTDAYPGDPDASMVTLEDLQKAIAELPLSVREILQRGPTTRGVDGCRVCDAVKLFYRRGFTRPWVDLIASYHAQRRTHADGPLDPEDGVACYLRCLLVYLLAGWDGVHDGDS